MSIALRVCQQLVLAAKKLISYIAELQNKNKLIIKVKKLLKDPVL